MGGPTPVASVGAAAYRCVKSAGEEARCRARLCPQGLSGGDLRQRPVRPEPRGPVGPVPLRLPARALLRSRCLRGGGSGAGGRTQPEVVAVRGHPPPDTDDGPAAPKPHLAPRRRDLHPRLRKDIANPTTSFWTPFTKQSRRRSERGALHSSQPARRRTNRLTRTRGAGLFQRATSYSALTICDETARRQTSE